MQCGDAEQRDYSYPSRIEWDGLRVHHAMQKENNLKPVNYFWNFSLNIFGPLLMVGN